MFRYGYTKEYKNGKPVRPIFVVMVVAVCIIVMIAIALR